MGWARFRLVGVGLLVFLIGVVALPSTIAAQGRDEDEDEKEEDQGPESLLESVKKIEKLMTQVEDLLSKLKTGRGTQEDQEKIIEELTRVIDFASSAGGGGGGGSSSPKGGRSKQDQGKEDGQSAKPKPDPKDGQKPGPRPILQPPGGGKSLNNRRKERREPRRPRPDPIRKILGSNALRWGDLPWRKRADVLDQQSEEVPLRFRGPVMKYRKKLAENDEE